MTFVMHHHIYKNAGMTIDWILHRNFPNQVLHIEGYRNARLSADQVKNAAQPYPEHQAISSHCTPLTSPEEAWAKCHITILRDPIERFYSMYRFDRSRTDDNPSSCMARESDFQGYCQWWIEMKDSLWCNWQTRCCTPQSWSNPKQSNSSRRGWDADLEAAIQAIKNTAFIGTVEQFDQSMLLLESRLQQKGIQFDAAYLRQNTMKGNSETTRNPHEVIEELLGTSLYERLKAENSMDYELLAHAQQLIDRRFSELDPSRFSLNDFQKRCLALKDSSIARSVRAPGQKSWIIVNTEEQ